MVEGVVLKGVLSPLNCASVAAHVLALHQAALDRDIATIERLLGDA